MTGHLSRRALLRGAGLGVGASLVGLGRLQRAIAQEAAPKRLVLVFSPNGTIPSAWEPSGTPDDYRFGPILAPLEPRRSDVLVLQGIDNLSARRGPGDGHQTGMGHLWTGRELLPGDVKGGCGGCDAVSWAAGPSIDQVVADQISAGTRFRSVELGALCGGQANVWTRMCYRRASEPLPPIDDPAIAFDRLFGAFSSENRESDRRRALRRSVLDYVKADFGRVAQDLGRESRHRVEQHLQTIRDIERQVFPETTGSTCIPPGMTAINPRSNDAYPELVSTQIRIGAAALGCDLTRVLSFQWNRSVGGVRMNWIGVNRGHHDMSHDGDSNQGSVNDLIAINRWYSERFLELIEALAAIPEGNGSVLDNTLIVWGNELGKGNSHTRNNIPFVLAGGRNGLIRPGRLLRYQERSHTDLLAAIGRAYGVDRTVFGDPQFSQGRFDDL